MDELKLQAFSEIILPPGSTSTDLQAAIDNAASGDTIIISGDMVFTGVVTMPANIGITIQSNDSNNWVMNVPGPNIRHIETNGNLILQNITLDGGAIGGGIQGNQDTSIVLKDGAIIKNCMNTGNGGGINANNGILIIDGGAIIENISEGGGGGICSYGANSLVQLLNGTVNNNRSKGNGGGVLAIHMEMRGGSVNYNYTDGGSGGGMYTATSLEMTGGEISYNEIKPLPAQNTASGGGLYCGGVSSATTTISGGKIHHNKVGVTPGGSRGGGICIFRGVKFLMNDVEVYENEATWGGGIFFDAYMQYGVPEENTIITGNTFIHDNRGAQGGGICFYNNVPGNPDIGLFGMAPQIKGNVRIIGNSASYGGGILFYPFLGVNTPTQLMMNATISENVEISGNKAASRGAGVDIQDDNKGRGVIAALTITGNITIQENEITTDTGMGGGIFGMNSNLTMQNKVLVSDNTGNDLGGGIYLINSTFNMSESTVSGNTANFGGGIYIRNSTLSMENSILNGNTANDGSGGGMYLRDNINAELTKGCSITNNHAPNGDGGGIYTEDPTYGNLFTGADTEFSCNRASAAYAPPPDAGTLYPNIQFASTTITDHPLNNFDINYTEGEPITVAYNVTYDANGGTGSYTGPDIEPGGTDTVLSSDETGISREDYAFTGWNTEPDGSGTDYYQGNSIILNCNATVLYAQWVVAEKFTVTYGANGGSGSFEDSGRQFGTRYTILSPRQARINRPGFTFTSWNTNRDGSGTSSAPGDIITIIGDMTLYALWRQNPTPEPKRICPKPVMKCRTAIEGQKIWDDNDNMENTRPDNIEILLLRNGEVYKRAIVDSEDDWAYGFCCLPVYKNSGNKYIYQIDEADVPGYTKTIEGYNVINTLTP